MGLKILLIDDNESNLFLVNAMLKPKGYLVTAVNSGRKGLDLLMNEKFDAVLLDLQMPDISGYDVMEKIKGSENPNKETPVAALTAYVTKGEREHCLEAGMKAFITKPFTANGLVKVIGEMVG